MGVVDGGPTHTLSPALNPSPPPPFPPHIPHCKWHKPRVVCWLFFTLLILFAENQPQNRLKIPQNTPKWPWGREAKMAAPQHHLFPRWLSGVNRVMDPPLRWPP